MWLNRVVMVFCALFSLPVLSSMMPENSIFQELRSALSSKKLVTGVNPKTGEIVGTGVCEGGTRAYERARMNALADVVSQLTESSFSSSRAFMISNDVVRSRDVVDIACSGYLIGAEEVARIIQKTSDGESVAVAVLWSIAKQNDAMSALSALANVEGDTKEIVAELKKCDDLMKRAGPVLWKSASGQRRFLGIAACKVKGTTTRELLSAMRLAKINAQKNLAQHFRCAISDERHLGGAFTEGTPTSVPKALNSFLQVVRSRTKGTIGFGKESLASTDYGVAEIFTEIKTVDNVKYAMSVCCLTTGAEAF